MNSLAPAVEVSNLKKIFKVGFFGRKVTAVEKVSLEVGQGQVYGLVGPNGAGKSTTLKLLLGFVKPTQGQGQVLGFPLGDRRARQRLGYLPELPSFPKYLTAREILSFHAQLAGVEGHGFSTRAQALLQRVGLARAANLRLSTYSKGMLQRCGLAVALVSDPDLLVLDEPMSGLDPLGRHDVRTIIQEEHAKGKTVLFSSHVLSDVEALCDHVAIVAQGKIFKAGPLATVTQGTTGAVDVRLENLSTAAQMALAKWGALTLRGNLWELELLDESLVQGALRQAMDLGAAVHSVLPRSNPLEDLLIQAQQQSPTSERISP